MSMTTFTFEEKLRARFIALPTALYKNDANFIAPFTKKIHTALSECNPFFARGRIQNIIAHEDGKDVARMSAIINPDATFDDGPVGHIGFYECAEDYNPAPLFETAYTFFHEHGIKRILGPITFSTWHDYRFLTKGFEHAHFYREPYNPPTYPAAFLAEGFSPLHAYYSSITPTDATVSERTAKQVARFFDAGYTVRTIDYRKKDEEFRMLYDLTMTIFKDNFGFTPISYDAFTQLYAGTERLVDKDYVLFAYDPKGAPVGFLFAYPDFSSAVRKMRGKQTLFSLLTFLMNKHAADTLIIKTLGVIPGFRRISVGSVLVALMHERAKAKGFQNVIHALMSENNTSRKIESDRSETFKEYALYEKRL